MLASVSTTSESALTAMIAPRKSPSFSAFARRRLASATASRRIERRSSARVTSAAAVARTMAFGRCAFA